MMGVAELDTARRYSLPLTVVVLNDHSMGEERHNLDHKGLPSKYADYPSPDFVALAGAYGASGYRIDRPISSTSSRRLSTTTPAWSSSTFASTVTTSTPSSATSPNTSRALPAEADKSELREHQPREITDYTADGARRGCRSSNLPTRAAATPSMQHTLSLAASARARRILITTR